MLVTIGVEDLAPIPYSIVQQGNIRSSFLRRYPNGVAVLDTSNPGELLHSNPLMRYYEGLQLIGLPKLTVSDYKFGGVLLNYYRLNGMEFRNCQFDGVGLRNARLEGTVWTGCDLNHINLTSSRLTGAQLQHCRISHTTFKDACLHNATLAYCVFTAVDFRDSALGAIKLLSHCRFDNCRGVPDRFLQMSHATPLEAATPSAVSATVKGYNLGEFRTRSIDVVF